MQNAVNIPNRFCRKRLAPARAALEAVERLLDLWCFERLQLDSAERGLDRAFHLVLVGRAGQRLHIARVLRKPDVEPVGHGQFRRLLIGRVIDRHGYALHLLTDFLLRLTGEAATNLFARPRINADRQSRFPIRVFPTVPKDGLFSYAARSRGVSFCHISPPPIWSYLQVLHAECRLHGKDQFLLLSSKCPPAAFLTCW